MKVFEEDMSKPEKKSSKKKKQSKSFSHTHRTFLLFFYKRFSSKKKAQKKQIHDRQISLWHSALDSKKIRKSSVTFSANFFWTRISKCNVLGPKPVSGIWWKLCITRRKFLLFFYKGFSSKKSTKKANSRWTDIALAWRSRLKKN